ncbi:MAG: glycosyltransferase [Desulfobacteraceae bacterium]|nr:glycosyltransferase [Desulfobacteraceae bacterium]
MPSQAKSICFVVPRISCFMDANPAAGSIGGAEVQQFHLGNYLSGHGWQVSFTAQDAGQFAGGVEVRQNRIRHIKCFDAVKGSRGISGMVAWLAGLWRAMSAADASIYYQRCAGLITGVVAAFCKTHGRRFVYAGANDWNFFPPRDLQLQALQERTGYRYALKRADLITVQSLTQLHLLKKNWGLDGTFIPNCLPEGPGNETAGKPGKYFLWVGGMRRAKRPDRLAALARACPDLRFVMISGGAKDSDDYTERMNEQIRSVPNIDCRGFVPYPETHAYFESAIALVNTSDYEGFSNTFLQALRAGIPIVSYLDPDGILAENSIGFPVRSDKELIETIREISMMDLSEQSAACRDFFKRTYSLDAVGARFDGLFSSLLR